MLLLSSERETIQLGHKGGKVSYLQHVLTNVAQLHKRPDFNPQGIDGDFGSRTLNAVKNFQAAVGLHPDGIYGINTDAALEAVMNSPFGTIGWYTAPGAVIPTIAPRPTPTPIPPIPSPTPSPTPSPMPRPGDAGPVQKPLDWTTIGIIAAVALFGIMLLTDDKK